MNTLDARIMDTLNDNILLDYHKFINDYVEIGAYYRKIYTINADYDKLQGYINIGNLCEIECFSVTGNNLNYDILGYTKVLFLIELYLLGLPTEKIQGISKNIYKHGRLKNLEYFLDYYIHLAKYGSEINFYINNDFVFLLSAEEFYLNKKLGQFDDNFIVVSLNGIVRKLFRDYNIDNNVNSLYSLSAEEARVITEMNLTPGLQGLEIKMDKSSFKPKELDLHIDSKFEFKNSEDLQKIKDEAKKMGYGVIGELKTHKGKLYVTGSQIKKIRLDKDEGRDNI